MRVPHGCDRGWTCWRWSGVKPQPSNCFDKRNSTTNFFLNKARATTSSQKWVGWTMMDTSGCFFLCFGPAGQTSLDVTITYWQFRAFFLNRQILCDKACVNYEPTSIFVTPVAISGSRHWVLRQASSFTSWMLFFGRRYLNDNQYSVCDQSFSYFARSSQSETSDHVGLESKRSTDIGIRT